MDTPGQQKVTAPCHTHGRIKLSSSWLCVCVPAFWSMYPGSDVVAQLGRKLSQGKLDKGHLGSFQVVSHNSRWSYSSLKLRSFMCKPSEYRWSVTSRKIGPWAFSRGKDKGVIWELIEYLQDMVSVTKLELKRSCRKQPLEDYRPNLPAAPWYFNKLSKRNAPSEKISCSYGNLMFSIIISKWISHFVSFQDTLGPCMSEAYFYNILVPPKNTRLFINSAPTAVPTTDIWRGNGRGPRLERRGTCVQILSSHAWTVAFHI